MWRSGSISSSSSARCGVVVSTLLLAGAAPGRPAPLRLAIYYGYPSLVNGAAGDLAVALSQMARYDVLVLGDGLEFATDEGGHAGHEEYVFTTRLVRQLSRTPRQPSIFGYIDLGRTQGLPAADILDRIDRWAEMGVEGVFLDEAGYDFGVTRARQNMAVRAAHARNLRVCFNAYRPEDVFGLAAVPINDAGGGNPEGASPLLSERDALLLESFALSNGDAEPIARLERRVDEAIVGRRRFGSQIFAVATGDDEPALAHYGWWLASVFGLDAYGWSAPGYGAIASRLDVVQPPDAEATLGHARFADPAPRFTSGGWRRRTTAGTIVVDAGTRRGGLDSLGKDDGSWNGLTR